MTRRGVTVGILVACFACAETSNLVEVKTLDPKSVAEILDADKAVDKAVEALAAAKVHLDVATARRDALTQIALGGVSVYEEKCPSTGSMMTTEVKYRKYRRAELRGKYVLVTEGSEPCAWSAWKVINN